MIFNTWIFGFFLTFVFLIYWFVLKPKWRPYGLLIAGLVFYTYYFPAHTLIIGLLALSVYVSGIILEKYRKHHTDVTWKKPFVAMWITVTICILVLGYYKYLKLLFSTINDIMQATGSAKSFAIPEILVPLGLSFFIFEFIHYTIDAYHGRIKPASIFEFGTFVFFFPTLVAGPIKRFQSFLTQLREEKSYKPEYLTKGLSRIIIGLGKKILIADFIGMFALPLTDYGSNPNVSALTLMLAIYAYAVKIYFDFSGYSDIAIGCAYLLGYEVPENFNWPYLASNIGEFWRRWHMSLSNWLRDYLYMPIGKKLMPSIGRKSPLLLAAICQTITMGVCGLWHGAYWNFLIWGLYHGFGLTVHKGFSDMVTKIRQKRDGTDNAKSNVAGLNNSTAISYTTKVLSILVTFHFVCIGWVFFVLNIKDSFKVLAKLFGGVFR